MQRISHREFLLWCDYLDEEWNTPSRSDHYLMQIAQEVRRVLSKKPNKIKLKEFLFKFTRSSEKERQKPEEQKAIFNSILGIQKDG
jgi:hypothetical protein